MEFSEAVNIATIALLIWAVALAIKRSRAPKGQQKGFRLTPFLLIVSACLLYVGAPLLRESFHEWIRHP